MLHNIVHGTPDFRADSYSCVMNISWDEFQKIDMRVGEVLNAQPFEEARNPAYKLEIDFGELGIKKSSAQVTKHYNPEDLVGKRVVAVVNFPPKQIANMMSECLVLGAYDEDGGVVLLETESKVKPGSRIG